MIEIKNATIINSDNKLDSNINVTFDKGMTILPIAKKHIFNFLAFKNVVLNSGEFIVGGVKIVPLENRELCLFLLTVDSQNIKMHVCFSTYFLEKKETFNSIIDELTKLKDLPLTTEEEKKAKLQRIFEIIKKYNVVYILLNSNDKTNIDSKKLIEEVIEENESEITFISLEYNPLEFAALKEREKDNATLVSFTPIPTPEVLAVAERKREKEHAKELAKEAKEEAKKARLELKATKHLQEHQKALAPTTKKVVKPKPKKVALRPGLRTEILAETFKKNWLVFLLQILTVTFSVFLFSMIPYLFVEKEMITVIIIALNAAIAFIVGIFIVISSFDFLDKPDDFTKVRYHVVTTASLISIVMGIIAGFAALLLLGKYEVLLTLDKYQPVYSVLGFGVAGIFIIILFLAKPIRKIIRKFKKLSKKKDKSRLEK